MSEIKMTFRATKQQLAAAIQRRQEDVDCVLVFLAGAKAENATLVGRRATDAFAAACRLLNVDEDTALNAFDKAKEGAP